MKEVKQLRWRSLAAFLVPVLFAVYMMQPTPVSRLTPPGQPSVALVAGATELYPVDIQPEADLASLLGSRWCVRSSEQVTPVDGDLVLLWQGKSFLLRSDRQYLIDNDADGLTRQIPGKPLYGQVLALLEIPANRLPVSEQEAHT